MLNMFEKEKPQKGYQYLIQKNARCPICGGTLKKYEDEKDIIISCINCETRMRVVAEGKTEDEFTVRVI